MPNEWAFFPVKFREYIYVGTSPYTVGSKHWRKYLSVMVIYIRKLSQLVSKTHGIRIRIMSHRLLKDIKY